MWIMFTIRFKTRELVEEGTIVNDWGIKVFDLKVPEHF